MKNEISKVNATPTQKSHKDTKQQAGSGQSQRSPLFKITKLKTEKASVVLEQCCIR